MLVDTSFSKFTTVTFILAPLLANVLIIPAWKHSFSVSDLYSITTFIFLLATISIWFKRTWLSSSKVYVILTFSFFWLFKILILLLALEKTIFSSSLLFPKTNSLFETFSSISLFSFIIWTFSNSGIIFGICASISILFILKLFAVLIGVSFNFSITSILSNIFGFVFIGTIYIF